MPVPIADAGFLIALTSPDPKEKSWARVELKKWGAPVLTCDGAVIEASHFCAPALIARMLEDGSFQLAFDLAAQISQVRKLLEKYKDQEMDMVDACIVRMSELYPDCIVLSVDHDFDVYRRFKNERIPVSYPPT